MHDPCLLIRKIRGALAPCSLGCWPTPLELQAELATGAGLEILWVKREDRSARVYGGNKVRGLEFLLSGATPGTVFVTAGGSGSTHCLATAVHAAALSCSTVLAQFAQPETAEALAVAAACRRVAAGTVLVSSLALLPLAVARSWLAARRLGAPRWIPGGGAESGAVVGHLLAGLELAAQASTVPDAIVTPHGSGGTAAGLALAVSALGWPTRVIAVRVAPRLVANRLRVVGLACGAARLLRSIGVDVPRIAAPLVLEGGGGYGHPTRAGELAHRRAAAHGLALDPTYTAKAFAALPVLAPMGFRRVVFWHTFAPPTATLEPAR